MKLIAVALIATTMLAPRASCTLPEPKDCTPQTGIPCTGTACPECGPAGGTWTRHADCSVSVFCAPDDGGDLWGSLPSCDK